MKDKPLHIAYLSVTSDVLSDPQHFRREYLKGLGKRVKTLSYLVHAPQSTQRDPIPLSPNVTLYPVVADNKCGYIVRAIEMLAKLHQRQPVDLTVCMTPVATAAIGHWLQKKRDVPYLVHWSHDFLGDWGWRLESPTHMLYWPLILWLCRRANSVRAISEPLAVSVLKGGISADRLKLLPTLVQTDWFFGAESPNSAANPFGGTESANQKNILFVGRLAKQKNVSLLFQSLQKLLERGKQAHLWLIGEGERRRSLERLIRKMRLQNRVHLTGWLPLQCLQPYYAYCDVFVLPSNHEGLGRVLAEASLCAAPIVCTWVGGVTDHVLHEATGLLVRPDDLNDLTASIEVLLDDPERAKGMGQAAQRFIRQKYPNIEEQYDLWVEYWGKVVKGC